MSRYLPETPLSQAIDAGDFDRINQLVENGDVYINRCVRNHKNPLFIAYSSNKDKICRYLLAHGANPNICDDDNNFPFTTNTEFQLRDIATKLMLEELDEDKKQ